MHIRWPYGRGFYRHRAFRDARAWSNRILMEIAPVFTGAVINVSAWRDEDKEGLRYRDYFKNASGYTISNHTGDRGATGQSDEIALDLSEELPGDLEEAFDVVFNHTTLEHIYDVQTAFSNLCRMSRDAVIIVVPFMQPTHVTASYADFWRFTPQLIRRMFADNGMVVIYENSNHPSPSAIYLISIAVRDPDRWQGKLPVSHVCDQDLGSLVFQAVPLWRSLCSRVFGRKP